MEPSVATKTKLLKVKKKKYKDKSFLNNVILPVWTCSGWPHNRIKQGWGKTLFEILLAELIINQLHERPGKGLLILVKLAFYVSRFK